MSKNASSQSSKPEKRHPFLWIPSLYFAEGLPYVIVMTVSVIFYKRMNLSNGEIAFYTGWLYLPWVIKPFWSPVVDLLKTKRWWIIIMQLLIGGGLGCVALTIPMPFFFQATLLFFWLLAFSSATHDISADGFYMLALNESDQSFFVGIRSTFYRFAMITGQGILIIVAGFFETATGLPPVEITATADPVCTQEVTIPQIDQNHLSNQSYFAVFPQQIKISTQNIAKEKLDSIQISVRQHNITNNFIQPEKAKPASTPSWWTINISEPLKNFIKQNINSQDKPAIQNKLAGNVAVVGIQLTCKPEANKEMVLNTKFKNGDNSISLIEGEHLTFNANNWNKPAYILLQADPKLNRISEASFTGTSGNIPLAWSITFLILAGLFMLFTVYHRFILPYPASDKPVRNSDQNIFNEFFKTFTSFFQHKEIGLILSFLLLYRLGEAQLVKMASPFLLDSRQLGGLGLTTGDVGIIYGTIGIIALTIGGILGGIAISRKGLKFWLWWMFLAINIPHLAYVYLSYAQPDNYFSISFCVAIEQFSYGFGFTAYMIYMIYISEGKNKTAHYAIATAFMALGMMIPGMFSGWLQEIIGYKSFFIWVMLCMVPGFFLLKQIKVDESFGKMKK
jgi:PAT family beta-lactamase induction signal transducer AmpG